MKSHIPVVFNDICNMQANKSRSNLDVGTQRVGNQLVGFIDH